MTRTGMRLREFLDGIDFDPTTLAESEIVTLLSSIAAVEQSNLLRQAEALS